MRRRAAILLVLAVPLFTGGKALRESLRCYRAAGMNQAVRADQRYERIKRLLPPRGTVEYVTGAALQSNPSRLALLNSDAFKRLCGAYLETGSYPSGCFLPREEFDSILLNQLQLFRTIIHAQFALSPIVLYSRMLDYLNECTAYNRTFGHPEFPDWLIKDYPNPEISAAAGCPENYAVKRLFAEEGLILYERVR